MGRDSSNNTWKWVQENLHPDVIAKYRVEVLHDSRENGQHVLVGRHPRLGNMLLIDGAVQLSARDEPQYAEMLAHVPIVGHGSVADVLTIGGGDCAVAREVLRHEGVRSVTQVEIDRTILDVSREFFPEFYGPVFADPRFTSVIGDGAKYVASTEKKYHLIIVDSPDPQGPAAVLFSRQFYEGCRRCLQHNGILVTQNGVPFYQRAELLSTMRRFSSLFPHWGCYVVARPMYVGGLLAIGWASPSIDLKEVSRSVVDRRVGVEHTQYWSPEMQAASFALPPFIEDILVEAVK